MIGMNPAPPSPKRIREIQRDIQNAMKPYVQMKLEILNLARPRITIKPGEPAESVYPPDVQAQLDEIDALADEAQKRMLEQYGFTPTPR